MPVGLPGTVDPLGLEGAVAAGGWADEPDAPVADLPVCAAQKATSAAWHAPTTSMRERNFMLGLLSPREAAYIMSIMEVAQGSNLNRIFVRKPNPGQSACPADSRV